MGYKLMGREYNERSLLNLIIMISPNPITPNPLPTNSVTPGPVTLPMNPVITPTPNVPVTTPKRKSNVFLIFFLVIVLTLVIGILVGYYLSSTNTIPDINIPSITQTPEVTPTVTVGDPTPSFNANNPVTATPEPIELSKSYKTTVLPWEYSFKYPSNWTSNEISNQTGSLTMSFAKDHTGCAQGESICSIVFAVNVAAEMIDSAVATPISTEEIVIQNEGPVRITLYQYVSNGNHFYMIPIRNGWIMANVASGRDDEAGALFKQILGSYISEESPDAF